jgi:hypothetical protein
MSIIWTTVWSILQTNELRVEGGGTKQRKGELSAGEGLVNSYSDTAHRMYTSRIYDHDICLYHNERYTTKLCQTNMLFFLDLCALRLQKDFVGVRSSCNRCLYHEIVFDQLSLFS